VGNNANRTLPNSFANMARRAHGPSSRAPRMVSAKSLPHSWPPRVSI
jgi:hypothetical protein